MVMEVDADMGEIALEKVKEVDGTIKARVLF
jgi:D-3-phosphoglycerate dehydrogenase